MKQLFRRHWDGGHVREVVGKEQLARTAVENYVNDAQPIFCRTLIGTVLSQSTVPIRIPARNLLTYKQVAATAGNDTERGGFEPPVKFDPHAALAKRSYRPLSHLSSVLRPGDSYSWDRGKNKAGLRAVHGSATRARLVERPVGLSPHPRLPLRALSFRHQGGHQA